MRWGGFWAVLIRGDLAVPGFSSGFARDHLRTIGMKCTELGIPLEGSDNMYKRINPIADRAGDFIFTVNIEGRKTMTDDSHIPCLTLSKIRNIHWCWPARMGPNIP